MRIIVTGASQEIDFVQRLCRDKVRRGILTILPATSPACDEVVRLKNERDEALAKLKEKEARNTQLTAENQELICKVTELEQSLISITTVLENTETVLNNTENADNTDERVPKTVPNNFDLMEDNKNIDVEDMTEVNLDDVKDTTETDTKEAPAPTPKKNRKSKKSE